MNDLKNLNNRQQIVFALAIVITIVGLIGVLMGQRWPAVILTGLGLISATHIGRKSTDDE